MFSFSFLENCAKKEETLLVYFDYQKVNFLCLCNDQCNFLLELNYLPFLISFAAQTGRLVSDTLNTSWWVWQVISDIFSRWGSLSIRTYGGSCRQLLLWGHCNQRGSFMLYTQESKHTTGHWQNITLCFFKFIATRYCPYRALSTVTAWRFITQCTWKSACDKVFEWMFIIKFGVLDRRLLMICIT